MGDPGKWTAENLQSLAIFLTYENLGIQEKRYKQHCHVLDPVEAVLWGISPSHHHQSSFFHIIYDFVTVRQLKPLQEECKHQ